MDASGFTTTIKSKNEKQRITDWRFVEGHLNIPLTMADALIKETLERAAGGGAAYLNVRLR